MCYFRTLSTDMFKFDFNGENATTISAFCNAHHVFILAYLNCKITTTILVFLQYLLKIRLTLILTVNMLLQS